MRSDAARGCAIINPSTGSSSVHVGVYHLNPFAYNLCETSYHRMLDCYLSIQMCHATPVAYDCYLSIQMCHATPIAVSYHLAQPRRSEKSFASAIATFSWTFSPARDDNDASLPSPHDATASMAPPLSLSAVRRENSGCPTTSTATHPTTDVCMFT